MGKFAAVKANFIVCQVNADEVLFVIDEKVGNALGGFNGQGAFDDANEANTNWKILGCGSDTVFYGGVNFIPPQM